MKNIDDEFIVDWRLIEIPEQENKEEQIEYPIEKTKQELYKTSEINYRSYNHFF
jgi:hypothetical protein